MQLTQHKLVIEWIKTHRIITPAKMAGKVFKKTMFGSETAKRCRELRAKKLLNSLRDGKYVSFYATQKLLKIIEK